MDFTLSVADQVDGGRPPSTKQIRILEKKTRELVDVPAGPDPSAMEDTEEQERLDPQSDRIERVRSLWRSARDRGDNWLMDFAESIGQRIKAGLPLTRKQEDKLNLEMNQARVASRVAAIWISKRYQN